MCKRRNGRANKNKNKGKNILTGWEKGKGKGYDVKAPLRITGGTRFGA
jgi:hypothetical protein